MAKRSSEEVKRVTEALLFAAGSPLPPKKIAQIIGDTDVRAVRQQIEALSQEYDEEARAFQVQEVAGGYQVRTRPDFGDYVLQLKRDRDDSRLSHAALEALAIVAYKQPVSRADIVAIRGVESDEVIRGLARRRLIKVVGRKEEPGRPLLYGTTQAFLEKFGIRTLDGLPELDEVLPKGPDFRAGR